MQTETIALADLKPHPRNYVEHPDDQIEHLIESITEHGVYRNIVIAKDNTILAGHGVVKALRRMERPSVEVYRLPIDPDDPRALKVLAGDNEIRHLAEVDDRALSEILRDIRESDPVGLLGTGYDEMMLANLVMVTRPQSEIENIDAAAHWAGLPVYDGIETPWRLVVHFDDGEDRKAFCRKLGIELADSTKSIHWPMRPDDDPDSVRIQT